MTNQVNSQSIIPSTDVIQLTLSLKMTTAQVVETSVTVNNNSPIHYYVHSDNQTQTTFEKKTLSQTNNTATIKSAIQLLALKQFSLSGHLKLQMYKNAVNYTSYTCSCIMDRSIFLLESFSNLLLINNAII